MPGRAWVSAGIIQTSWCVVVVNSAAEKPSAIVGCSIQTTCLKQPTSSPTGCSEEVPQLTGVADKTAPKHRLTVVVVGLIEEGLVPISAVLYLSSLLSSPASQLQPVCNTELTNGPSAYSGVQILSFT